jgi:hypothetical protein
MNHFKTFYLFLSFCTLLSLESQGQKSSIPGYDWSTFNLVDLDTVKINDDFKNLPVVIIYNYHKEALASPDEPYTKLYKAIRINTEQGIADFEKDRLMIETFDRIVSFGMRVTDRNGNPKEINRTELERESSLKLKPKSNIRFTTYSAYDMDSELFYPKPRVEIGDLVEIYCKVRPYSQRLSGELKVNEVLPVNAGCIEVMTKKPENHGYRERMIPVNNPVLLYAVQPKLMDAKDFQENNNYAFQTFYYSDVKVNGNRKKAIPSLCYPHVVYAVISATHISYGENVKTLGWDNLIQIVSKNLDPFKTMKMDWVYFYTTVDSIKNSHKDLSSLEIFRKAEQYVSNTVSIKELDGDENYYSPGYYLKTKKINKSSVLPALAAILHRLDHEYYIGVSRKKHDGPAAFESHLFLDQYFLAVPNGESYDIYFEPTDAGYYVKNEIPVELLGMEAYIFKPYGKVKEILAIDLPQNNKNLNKRITKLDVSYKEDIVSVHGTQKLSYSLSTDYRFSLKKKYDKSSWRLLSGQLSGLDWHTLDSASLSSKDAYNKFEIDYTYNLTEDKFSLYDLIPENILPEVSEEQRYYNYYGDYAKKESVIILIHMPEGSTMADLDKFNQSFENEAGKVRIIASGFGQMVNFQIQLELKEYNFAPADYGVLRDFVTTTKGYLESPLSISK